MACEIDVLFTPAEHAALHRQELSGSVCVVFDVLRATSVMVAALANGAEGIIPVQDIPEALELRRLRPGVLLGGERGGLRITAQQTGGVDFDLGNSPREYTPARVAGKMIVATTTNGTRALRACLKADTVIASSFLNLKASAEFVARRLPAKLHLVCAGTGDSTSFEDVLAAGAFCDALMRLAPEHQLADSAWVAWRACRHTPDDLPATSRFSLNARRLRANPELTDDVEFCLRRDCFHLVALLGKDGVVRKSD